MGKGAKADSMKAEQTEGLLALEEGFSTKLGTTSKCCCCKLSVGVQVIAVLIILSALNYFMTFVSRTGAPCFFWYKHVATTITVVMGMSVRIVAIPFAVLGMLGARKAEDKGPRMFFFCLLGLGFVCFLDLFLCLFEVHAVCGSAELADWNSCSHDWGKNQFQCVAADTTDASAVTACAAVEAALPQNGGGGRNRDSGVVGPDKETCEGVAMCEYTEVPEAEWVVPECCEHEDWAHDKGPCNRAPAERVAEFDVGGCEFFSDVYDVGLGIVWSLVLLLMAWYVNSYRVELATQDGGDGKGSEPEFVNPMEESKLELEIE